MTKRAFNKYVRHERGFYPTPSTALVPLLPFISDLTDFAEPMCGDGALIRGLEAQGKRCVYAMDLDPQDGAPRAAQRRDVLYTLPGDIGCSTVISNPPWPLPGRRDGFPTVAIIEHLVRLVSEVWFILSADFMHNRYFNRVYRACSTIVSTGRVKWMAGSDGVGFDNSAWYRFSLNSVPSRPTFYPNAA